MGRCCEKGLSFVEVIKDTLSVENKKAAIKLSQLFLTPSAATACGPEKHLKPTAAPKLRMLDKLTGVFAPCPSTSPHKLGNV